MSFKEDVNRFIKDDVDGGVLKIVTDMEKYIYTEIVNSAAVASGAFKANINRDKGSPSGKFDKSKTSSIQGPSPVDDPYAVYYVSSAAPYARRLEYGWSDKQPIGLFNLVATAANAKFR